MNVVADTGLPTVAGLFADTAAKVSRRKKLLIAPRPLTYGTALDQIARLMAMFQAHGLRPGDSVVISVEEDDAVLPIFLACFRYGLPVTVIDIDATVSEARALFALIDAEGIFVSRGVAAKWQQDGLRDALTPKLFCVTDMTGTAGTVWSSVAFWKGGKGARGDRGEDTFPAVLDQYDPLQAPPEEPYAVDDAVRFFTSGTTGAPKVVRLSYAAVMSQASIMATQTQITGDSVLLSLFQFTQLGGLASGILLSFWNGCTLCRPVRKFTNTDIPLLLDAIFKHRVTHYYLVPAMMELFLKYGANLRQAFDTEDFRHFMCMAAHLPESLWLEFEKVTGHEVINSYGLTEANNLTYSGPRDATRNTQSTGKPAAALLRVVDDTGAEVPMGAAGALLVQSPTLMEDYYRNPDLTNDVLRDGWFHTGDLAKLDSDGNLHIIGRIKDVIISGGYNIYPEELNTALVAHPAIDQAFTFGVKADIWGEHPVSVVVANTPDLSVKEIVTHLRGSLSEFKIPKQIHFVDALPLTARGKVDKAAVMALVNDRAEARDGPALHDIKAEVIALAADTFFLDPSELTTSSAYNNTQGWDSLGHMMLIAAVEERFDLKIDTMDILRIQTLNDLVNLVSDRD